MAMSNSATFRAEMHIKTCFCANIFAGLHD
jgi:hypothetical protein